MKDQKDQINHEEQAHQHEPSTEKEAQEDSSLNDTEDADEGTSEASPEERIALLEAELAQQKEKYLRMFADFDNAKRRHAREKQEWFSTAGKDVILDILPVVDDFERAMQMETSEANADEKLESEGVQLIYQKLAGVLKKRGVEAIDEAALSNSLKNKNIKILVDLAEGDNEFTSWTSDLTEEYIKINADYRS